MGAGNIKPTHIDTTALEKGYKNKMAEYNEVVAKYVQTAREEAKTETQKAEELKKQYQQVLALTTDEDDRAAIEKKIKSIDDQIAEAKKSALDKEREELEKSFGISFDFSATPEKAQEELFNEEKAKLDAMYKEDGSGFIKSKEDLSKAIDRLREKYSDAASGDFSEQLGKVKTPDDLDALLAISSKVYRMRNKN